MEVNFILVHYHRTNFPAYIYTCIEQIRETNPKANIFLGYFSSCKVDYKRLKAAGCYLQDIGKYLWTPMHYLFKLKNRGIFTTERFFVIHEIMKHNHLQNVIHVENDCMVYINIERIISILQDNYDLGIVRENDEKCIASFVYIKETKYLKKLCRFLVKQKNVNDMYALSDFGYRNKLHYLPVVSNAYAKKEEMSYGPSEARIRVKQKEVYCENVEKFGCVFDGAAYGVYAGGLDVRFGLGDTRGYINDLDSCYSLTKCSMVWEKIDGINRPFYLYGTEKIPIANLHIYSKELDKFRARYPHELGER